jgi:hypothetical protein
MEPTLIINVVETNGIIDEEATEKAFHGKLRALAAERHAQRDQIAVAVASVFERFPGVRMNLPHVASMALASLNVDPTNYSKLERLCLAYIRANCQGNTVRDSVERPDSLFVMGKGRDGGVCRRADLQAAA